MEESMQRKSVFLVTSILFVSIPLFAQSKAAVDQSNNTDFALLFNFKNIESIASPYDDGLQTGAGMKYWFSDTLNMRALMSVLVEPYAWLDTTEVTVGLSVGAEFHPRPMKVSPYFGGIFGCKLYYDGTEILPAYYLGGISGVEVKIAQYFSIYAEYQAMFVFDANGLGFRLGDTAILGFAIYM
jgi:hypothetical protein